MNGYAIVFICACILFLSLVLARKRIRKKRKAEFFFDKEEEDVCVKDSQSREISQGILDKLKIDLHRVSLVQVQNGQSVEHNGQGDDSIPEIPVSKILPIIEKLKFFPLECCDLEDSLTEDKKKVFICVKNKKGKFYNYNKLMQVALHELAHAMSAKIDPKHTSKEFIGNYNFLLNRASGMGLIDVSRLSERL